ncbi:hypothetical protein B0J15DRAFT_469907 [Fusarium solani]|uniref:Uncharacterized protein n=1 Tax=Fusarium solani TaxID=169388 RepID=A0A9P9K3P0_FUSSL|nr:uncharacterized protein B0J15DRAFT_469907 [Fusarium solani]KAH7242850.1 hypothetical protein B0J15DRAFT_469907 [Fusarium solani]
MYTRARMMLSADKANADDTQWHEWVERESWNRLLGAVFIVSILTMVIYDVNPGLNATQDLELDPFGEEEVWYAKSLDRWQHLRSANWDQRKKVGARNLKDILLDIMMPGRYSGEDARLQVAQALADSWDTPSMTGTTGEGLTAALLQSTIKSLKGCQLFLDSCETSNYDTDTERDLQPLTLNCQAVLRMAYARLFKPASAPHCLSLRNLEPSGIGAAIKSLAEARLPRREPHPLDAVVKSFEALLVMKIHSIEMAREIAPSPTELELLEHIKGILEEAYYDFSESISLAAGVARAWAMFLQDRAGNTDLIG